MDTSIMVFLAVALTFLLGLVAVQSRKIEDSLRIKKKEPSRWPYIGFAWMAGSILLIVGMMSWRVLSDGEAIVASIAVPVLWAIAIGIVALLSSSRSKKRITYTYKRR